LPPKDESPSAIFTQLRVVEDPRSASSRQISPLWL